jgi:hypothetical protein
MECKAEVDAEAQVSSTARTYCPIPLVSCCLPKVLSANACLLLLMCASEILLHGIPS